MGGVCTSMKTIVDVAYNKTKIDNRQQQIQETMRWLTTTTMCNRDDDVDGQQRQHQHVTKTTTSQMQQQRDDGDDLQ